MTPTPRYRAQAEIVKKLSSRSKAFFQRFKREKKGEKQRPPISLPLKGPVLNYHAGISRGPTRKPSQPLDIAESSRGQYSLRRLWGNVVASPYHYGLERCRERIYLPAMSAPLHTASFDERNLVNASPEMASMAAAVSRMEKLPMVDLPHIELGRSPESLEPSLLEVREEKETIEAKLAQTKLQVLRVAEHPSKNVKHAVGDETLVRMTREVADLRAERNGLVVERNDLVAERNDLVAEGNFLREELEARKKQHEAQLEQLTVELEGLKESRDQLAQGIVLRKDYLVREISAAKKDAMLEARKQQAYFTQREAEYALEIQTLKAQLEGSKQEVSDQEMSSQEVDK